MAAVRWLIDRQDIDGVVNITSPNPLPNAAFMRELRDAWGAPFGLPARNWMLEVGAVFMGTETAAYSQEPSCRSRKAARARVRLFVSELEGRRG